jgi:hypothetical protein
MPLTSALVSCVFAYNYYSSRHDEAKENPRTVKYRVQILPSKSMLIDSFAFAEIKSIETASLHFEVYPPVSFPL